MNIARDIYQWFKKLGKKEFQPIHDSVTIEPKPVIQRKHQAVTRLSKSGTRYRLIKHDANKKANSPAYTQMIILK